MEFPKLLFITLIIIAVSCKLFESDTGFIEEIDFHDEKIQSINAFLSSIDASSRKLQYAQGPIDCLKRKITNDLIEFDTVLNLADYIGPLGKQKCFTTITNFRGINIGNLQYPIVLKYPRLVAFLARHAPGFMKIISFWLPHALHPKNGSVDALQVIKRNCPISKFLATFWEGDEGFDVVHDYCLRIIQHLFAFSSKPWNCEVQFGLFPFLELFQPKCQTWYYPRVFKYEGIFQTTTENLLSLNVPKKHVIITPALDETGLLPVQELMAGICRGLAADSLGDANVFQGAFFHGLVVTKFSKQQIWQNASFINGLKLSASFLRELPAKSLDKSASDGTVHATHIWTSRSLSDLFFHVLTFH